MSEATRLTKHQKNELLRGQLEAERSSFISHWRDLSDFIHPRRARFTVTDVNKGDRRNQKIIDSSGTLAARTLRSGMMSGVTSPARPWFRLTTPDPEMAEFGPVKEWLHGVSRSMGTIFLRSNLYNILPTTYGDIGVFATAAMSLEEDFDDVIRCHSFPIGSYMIGKDSRGRINTFVRDFRMTVRQLVEMFGARNEKTGKANWDNFSAQVKNLWDTGQTEAWIDVCHVVKPNDEWDPNKLVSKHKKFSSCYYERGTAQGGSYIRGEDEDKCLRDSGYDFFPILAPRWEVTGEDVYGTSCPGMEALGDIKALQVMQKRKAQAVEKMVNPPMVGPNALKNQKASILPGDITHLDVREGMQGFRPAHEVNARINELVMDIQDTRKTISRAFYEDLFLMLATSDRRDFTAREIDERHEEKLLAIGPVLEQLNQDLLDPLIDNTFDIMVRQGLVEPPPEELEGMRLKVEYTSIMAQAQKLVGVAGTERLLRFVSQVAQFAPDAVDKIDTDQVVDVYGDMTGVDPSIIRTDQEVEELRASRAQAQQKAQMAESIKSTAGAAKQLSETDITGDNALTAMLKAAGAGAMP